jgi:hypothetical protein
VSNEKLEQLVAFGERRYRADLRAAYALGVEDGKRDGKREAATSPRHVHDWFEWVGANSAGRDCRTCLLKQVAEWKDEVEG